MILKNRLQQDIIQAQKDQDSQKLSVLRFLFAEVKNLEIDKKRQELTDQEIQSLISGQIKKLNEDILFFEKGNRRDLIDKAKAEITILTGYLPRQLSDEELEKTINQIIAENKEINFPGALIGIAVKKIGGQADSNRIAQLINQKLQQQNEAPKE